ncbi:FKBP-type peptidyl-prolyl cis-trans isomerase [Bacteroides fragilis]|uniref:FKBP-type peptidyl-prolyl cis-trans isomerase n=1 Tax=Bacteroides fragilis TaxID=817 RepID=UPI002030581A|nr:FKBP-type peptidyl-prolyl cis-trans isomerase [Bacteroides fragilis]MCM0343485.1 FKBP-type peptidyl-prolyl cis-trans isomerase [Bacteroides fragilis]
MKKVSILAAVAIATGLASCTVQAPKATLKTDVDSLSYAIGISQTNGLKDYLSQRMEMDTAYIADFLKGVNDAANKTSKKDQAYLLGLQIGSQMAGPQAIKGMNHQLFADDSTMTVNKSDILAGVFAGVLNKDMKITPEEAQVLIQKMMESIKGKAAEKKYADNKAAGEKFLAENKTKEGVKTTASGLQYKVITEGKGEIPNDTCKVKVNYRGKLIDGTEFESTYTRNEPFVTNVGGVIKGWTEALKMMPVGSKWELYIPQELAYGSRDMGQIKPFSALVFEIELLGIEK